jgi:hypothetical protein
VDQPGVHEIEAVEKGRTVANSVVPLAVVRWPKPLQSSWIVTPSASVGV